MKKTLGFISVALLILVLLVGCSLSNQLEGTEWTKTATDTIDLYGTEMTAKYIFTISLQKSNAASFGQKFTVNGVIQEGSGTVSGTWVVEDDQLTVAIEDITISCTAEIKDDVLVITNTKVTGDESGAFTTSMFNGSWAKVTK